MKRHTDKKEFADYVCRPHCVFFREGEKQDMACGGAAAVAELVRRKRLSPHTIGGLSGGRRAPRDNDPFLLDSICRPCPFFVDGCDFRAPSPPPDAVPCGGLILLGLLLDERLIGREEIEAGIDG